MSFIFSKMFPITNDKTEYELIEKDYLIGSGLGDGTPMIQCANDSHRLLDLRFIDPFKTEYKLMNDVLDLDTPMYSKSKFYQAPEPHHRQPHMKHYFLDAL